MTDAELLARATEFDAETLDMNRIVIQRFSGRWIIRLWPSTMVLREDGSFRGESRVVRLDTPQAAFEAAIKAGAKL